MLPFWIGPLISVPEIFRQLSVVMSGETFVLSRDMGTIERNGTRVAQFNDVARVQIRSIGSGGWGEGDSYRLSRVLNSDEKLRLDQSSDENEITDVADDVADILGVEVTRKG